MARRPQRMPRWGYGAGAGVLVEPPSGEQESGWATNQRPPAQYFNWLFHHWSAWCDYLRGPSLARWETVALAYSVSVITYGALTVNDSTTEATTLITRNVIAAIDGGGNCVFTSVRGQVWTRRTNFTATGTFYRSRYLGGQHWICVDHATVGVLLTVAGNSAVLSGTGNWTASTLPATTAGVRGIAYDTTTGYFAAVTRAKIIASSGPASWTDATLGSVPAGLFTDIAWSGTAFLAVTASGEVYKANGGSAALGTWTALAALPPGTGAWRLSEGPNGQIVAWRETTGATLSFYSTTTDGTSWTEIVQSPSVERVRSLRYADSIWVASTTEAPYLWQSNDLTNWTRLKLPYNGSTTVFDCAYSEGSWVAVREAEALVSDRAEDLASGTWAADPMPTALSDAAYLRGRTISTTAPTNGHVLTWIASTSMWTPAAIESQSTTYTPGGTVTDYTADAQYAPAGLTAITGGSVSGRMGAGVGGDTPYFSAAYKTRIGALARNADGLRLTITAANSSSSPYPYAADGATLLIRVPPCGRDVQFDFRLKTNIETAHAVGGTDTLSIQLLVVRDDGTNRPYVLAGLDFNSYFPVLTGSLYEYYYVLASQGTFGTSPGTQFDISSGGEGTTAGITSRDVRIVIKGATMEILTGPAGGSLTRRAFYADVQACAWRGDLSVILSFGQAQSTPGAYYAEMQRYTVTPL